jgi:superfamily II DNA helicase RecQ
MGLKVEEFHSEQSAADQDKIISDFDGNQIQIICATKALGRGVDITCPVRFIIHTTMPISLTGTFKVYSIGSFCLHV